ncbi:hypothetical protein ACFY9C_35465 [Streptomyces filamentosus]|uniref:hypothetical protein n=1 Tax=Streptomyces filamentosus TaxID=67294 RepID=UPI0036EFE22E
MTHFAERPVQLADVARRAREAARPPFGLLVTRPYDPDTAVRVQRSEGSPMDALVHIADEEFVHRVQFWLEDAGYEVLADADALLRVRRGNPTASTLFEHVRDRCDDCFYEHDYNHALSEQMMLILRELVPYPDTGIYIEELEAFSYKVGFDRLDRLHEEYGHHSPFHLNNRYIFARQPETVILLERTVNAPADVARAFADAAFRPHLDDLAAAWEATARQPAR